ncbi:MAG: hypothetical protein JXQ96_19175 [Cyclobacteriaceae bacterium]
MCVANLRLLLPLLALVFVLDSCNNIPDCRNETTASSLGIKLYNSADSTLRQFDFDSIKAEGVDDPLYEDSLLAQYDLALSPDLNAVKFLFYEFPDIYCLEVGYDRSISVLSEECGPLLNFSGIEIKQHDFDSVAVVNDFLDQSFPDNLEIYF